MKRRCDGQACVHWRLCACALVCQQGQAQGQAQGQGAERGAWAGAGARTGARDRGRGTQVHKL